MADDILLERMLVKPPVPPGLEALRVTGSIEPFNFGVWTCEQFQVSESDMGFQLGDMFRFGRWCPPGVYTALYRCQTLVMSDTPDELEDCREIIEVASGRVLVCGLGLGVVVKGLVDKDSVTRVDVVEIDRDLIDAMYQAAPWIGNPKVTVWHGDAYEIDLPLRWDYAWLDVWDVICAENDVAGLKRKWRKQVRGWIGAWAEDLM